MTLPLLSRQATPPRQRLAFTFVGIFLDAILLGVVILQVFNYLTRFSSHRSWTRAVVLALLAFNFTQTICNGIGMLEVLYSLFDGTSWRAVATNPETLLSHLCGPFLMGIPHVILTLQCMQIVRSLSTWKKIHIRLFSLLLIVGTIVGFLSGCSAVTMQYIQARQNLTRTNNAVVDWFAVLMTVNLVSSATLDIVLASMMSYQLSKSKSSFSASTHIVQRLTLVLLRNGALLAALQLSACILYLTTWSYTMTFVLIINLGKVYTITALLAISAPLTAQSELQQPAGQHVDTSPRSSSLIPGSRAGSLVDKVWKMTGRGRKSSDGSFAGNDAECVLFEDLFEKSEFSTQLQPPSNTYQPYNNYILNDGLASAYSSRDSTPKSSPLSSPITQLINLRYILDQDMDGIVSPKSKVQPKLYPH